MLALFIEQVRRSARLKSQIEAWERLPTDQMTFQWLYGARCREIDNKRDKRFREQGLDALAKNKNDTLTPATLAVGNPKAAAKAKAKAANAANKAAKREAKKKKQDEGGKTPLPPPPPGMPNGACRWYFVSGTCTFWGQCREQHLRAEGTLTPAAPAAMIPKKPCWRWISTGTCVYGDNCSFEHGPKKKSTGKGKAKGKGGESKTPGMPCLIREKVDDVVPDQSPPARYGSLSGTVPNATPDAGMLASY